MIYERLRVFVSSRMQELAPERAAMRDALGELNIDGWVFEEDAGARPQGIQQTYKEEIDAADLYIGLFWRDYGEYTVDEFNYATERNKDRLIYEKRAGIDGKRDPKLQAFLDQVGKVETGLTARWFNTTEELREAVKQDAARWQTRKIRELRELNLSYKPSPLEAAERRDLKILLGKVKRFWLEGVLERTIRRAGLVELGKEIQPEAVGNPWEAVLELPYEGSRAVASGKGISEVFDEVEHSVLILGQPGSGKTTTLLTLVRELATRAERDPVHPIPVVFHLSSWVGPEQALDTWLVDELSDKYQIPRKIGKDWLERHRLLLLLDGLDEVKGEHRAACVEAVNRYAREIGLPGMVVCCRLEQYEELKVKLNLNGAICLRPLTDAQIDTYVEEAGAELGGLRAAFGQDSGLLELARSPLMLNLMCLAYRGYGAENLAGRETSEDRTKHLFSTYIDLMFKKRGTAELAYPRERTLGWLSWIARRLSGRNETMFLIEDLQPDWLPTGAQRWAYLAGLSVLLGLLIGGANIGYWLESLQPGQGLQEGESVLWLTAMPVWCLAFGWIEGLGSRSGLPFLERVSPGIPRAAAKGLIAAALWLPVALAATWWWEGAAAEYVVRHLLWAGIAIALVFGAAGRDRSINFSIKTVESLRWSLGNAWRGALLGLLGGSLVGGVVYIPGVYDLGGKNLIFLVGFATVGLGLGATLGGLKPYVFEGKTLPNQGMRLSLRMAALMGLHAVWLIAIVMGFWLLGFAEHSEGIGFFEITNSKSPSNTALRLFVPMFAVIFLWFGGLDVIKHYLLRAVLGASGQTPWNLARFLEQARGLNLMQRVGSAYIFVHRRLLEHLASSGKEDEGERAAETAALRLHRDQGR